MSPPNTRGVAGSRIFAFRQGQKLQEFLRRYRLRNRRRSRRVELPSLVFSVLQGTVPAELQLARAAQNEPADRELQRPRVVHVRCNADAAGKRARDSRPKARASRTRGRGARRLRGQSQAPGRTGKAGT